MQAKMPLPTTSTSSSFLPRRFSRVVRPKQLPVSPARIAGLETVYGLYAGLAPSFAYAVFGSSRQLAVGPVALVSLLVSHSLRDYIDPESPDPALKKLYAELAILLSLLVGLIKVRVNLGHILVVLIDL